MPLYEKAQATGTQSQLLMALEADWGVASTTTNYKALPVLPGETLDQAIAIYRSNVINTTRTRNPSVRGTQGPGGAIPQELAPRGQSQLIYHLLGGTPSTSGSGPYIHIVKAATSLPTGFSIEKGFLDLGTPNYFAGLGGRVDSAEFNFAVNAVALATFNVMFREMTSSTTSIASGHGTPTDQTSDPFTSVQVTVYEGSSLVVLATANRLRLQVQNQLKGDNYVLGSNFRANLKPGSRITTFDGDFLFDSVSLYNKAVNGTATKLQISISNGTYGIDFLLPAAKFIPNNSTPKISTDGPLNITLNGEGTYDSGQATDIKATITSPEATIDT
jgi:hypothetical protein